MHDNNEDEDDGVKCREEPATTTMEMRKRCGAAKCGQERDISVFPHLEMQPRLVDSFVCLCLDRNGSDVDITDLFMLLSNPLTVTSKCWETNYIFCNSNRWRNGTR